MSETIKNMLKQYNELPTFSSVGGYPLFYIIKNNEVLCAECANGYVLNGEADELAEVAINFEEDYLLCDECRGLILPAYGA